MSQKLAQTDRDFASKIKDLEDEKIKIAKQKDRAMEDIKTEMQVKLQTEHDEKKEMAERFKKDIAEKEQAVAEAENLVRKANEEMSQKLFVLENDIAHKNTLIEDTHKDNNLALEKIRKQLHDSIASHTATIADKDKHTHDLAIKLTAAMTDVDRLAATVTSIESVRDDQSRLIHGYRCQIEVSNARVAELEPVVADMEDKCDKARNLADSVIRVDAQTQMDDVEGLAQDDTNQDQLEILRDQLMESHRNETENLHAEYKNKISKMEGFIKKMIDDDQTPGGISARTRFKNSGKLASLTEVSSIEGSFGRPESSDQMAPDELRDQLGMALKKIDLSKLNLREVGEGRQEKSFLTSRIHKLEDDLKAQNDRLQKVLDMEEAEKENLKAHLSDTKIILNDERELIARLKKQNEDDRKHFTKQIIELSEEINRQKNQIMNKMGDIQSLKQMRDDELQGFTLSVAEFNRHLEDERNEFNEKLRELNTEKRKQMDMLTKKIQELHEQQEKEKVQLSRDIAVEKENKHMLQENFNEKDAAMKKLIEEYTIEVERLKFENVELRTEYNEAKQTIQEFMSQMDPEDSGDFQNDKSMNFGFSTMKRKMNHNMTMLIDDNPSMNDRQSPFLTRCMSNLNLGNLSYENRMEPTSPMSPDFLSPTMVKSKGKRAFGGLGLRVTPSEDEIMKKANERISLNNKFRTTSEHHDPSINNDTPQETNLKMNDKVLEIAHDHSSLSSSESQSESESESAKGPVEKDVNKVFKVGRRINLLPVQKRIYKQKIPEITNIKEAKERIKQICDFNPVRLSRGMNNNNHRWCM